MRPKTSYRRNLPHYQPPNGLFHVVFRLAGSVPANVIENIQNDASLLRRRLSCILSPQLRLEKAEEYRRFCFDEFERALHAGSTGPQWLLLPAVASVVAEAILYRDARDYDLLAYIIMPNHVHMVLQLLDTVERNDIPLYRILQSLKRYTARRANCWLHRSGAFWQAESYDHLIRDSTELQRTINYVLLNPVKAGLVECVEAWPWRYCKYETGL